VIDDGSVDGSPALIEWILKECPFFCEFIVRPNKGLCATLNEGLQRSRGKYFAYLGSDDVWLQNFLRARVALMESRPEAVLGYGHTYVIDESEQVIACTTDWAEYRDGNAREMLLHYAVPLSPTVVYRREVLQQHRWNEMVGLEDYDLYLRLCKDGDFAFDPQILSAWRQHPQNTSQSLGFMLEECLESQRRAADLLGISAQELKKAHEAVSWKYALDFIKTGQRARALGLLCRSFRGAPSLPTIIRAVAGLFLPQCAMRWRRKMLRRRNINYYGSIQI
jgi:glycosyltransferase involved in cell wall biosynthesis